MGEAVQFSKVSRKWALIPYGKVENVSFSLSRGEILCALGKRQSGIYLLPPMILGALLPHSGSIRVLESFPANTEIMKKIAYLPYGFSPPASQTLWQWLTLVMSIYQIPHPENRLKLFLRERGIEQWKKSPWSSLPKNLRKELSLHYIELLEPLLTILEMPFEGISEEQFSFWKDWTRNITGRGGSIFLVCHNLGEFELYLNPRTIFFLQGRIIWDGEYADLHLRFSCSAIEVDEIPYEMVQKLPILFQDVQHQSVFLHIWKKNEEGVVTQLQEWGIPIRSILPYQSTLQELVFG
ncbi:MAG: hypothetical protein V2G48_00345 [bacterium JZ-2024 1]